jgi:hypothetical protein
MEGWLKIILGMKKDVQIFDRVKKYTISCLNMTCGMDNLL